MAKTGIPRDPKIYFSLFVLFVLLLLMMPRTGKFNYDYKKGSPWAYETLVSQIDFPVLKTQEQIQSEKDAAGYSIVPYYKFSASAAQDVMREAEGLNYGQYSYMRPKVIAVLSEIYKRGVMADEVSGKEENIASDDIIFVQKDKRATKLPASDVYTVSGAKAALLSEMSRAFPDVLTDSVMTACGVDDVILPDLFYD